MVSYSYRMPAGIPGDVNRIASATIETQNVTPQGTTGAPTAYGIPMVVDGTAGNVGNMRTMTSSDAVPYGFLVRPYPTQSSQDPLNVSTPPTQGFVDILKRGYMTVTLNGPTAAAKGGAVWIYLGTTNATHAVLGGVEAATAAGQTSIQVANSYFMGPADSNGIVEIAFNI